jgi:hypothetical protein
MTELEKRPIGPASLEERGTIQLQQQLTAGAALEDAERNGDGPVFDGKRRLQ